MDGSQSEKPPMAITWPRIVRNVAFGGYGDEAEVFLQLRNEFPGIGGTIVTQQTVRAAKRVTLSGLPGAGHRTYLKHVMLKKLDDYFCRTSQYTYPHISRPLGSFAPDNNPEREMGYLYEWVPGSDGFAWEYQSSEGAEHVQLEEWGVFIALFSEAGIPLNKDIAQNDNGLISKNIVHELSGTFECELNLLWKRIDFGENSLYVQYDVLGEFLDAHATALKETLGRLRYELLMLSYKFLISHEGLCERDLGRLELLEREYRLSALRQHNPVVVA
ncbi:MAG: hypothetical protein Q8Q39_02145 [bacterium]|nr:hypothetical protein [bacterium]